MTVMTQMKFNIESRRQNSLVASFYWNPCIILARTFCWPFPLWNYSKLQCRPGLMYGFLFSISLQEKESRPLKNSGIRCLLMLHGINQLLSCLMIWIKLSLLPASCKKWVEKHCINSDLLKVGELKQWWLLLVDWIKMKKNYVICSQQSKCLFESAECIGAIMLQSWIIEEREWGGKNVLEQSTYNTIVLKQL